MGFFDRIRKRNRNPKENVLTEKEEELLEEGIERRIRKQQESKEQTQEDESIEDYEPTISYEDSQEEEFPIHGTQTREEYIQAIIDNCEQIIETERQTKHAKIEYQAVTEYLSDLQKIERMEVEEKKNLEDAAAKVIRFTKERENYQQKEIHTSNPRFRPLRNYEGNIMEDLKRMREQEEYSKKVKNDLRQLTAERDSLKYEYKEVFHKQDTLKKIAIATFALVISLFVLFWVLSVGLEQSMVIPYSMTVLMAAGIAGYVFYESYRNRYDHALIGKKINRAIALTNKVKIKYINNTSTLDYSYSKYNVENSMELEYLLKEYTKAKEQERTYRSNTERLDYYRNKIVNILEHHKVKDSEIWIYQATALVDSAEFEGIKKNLEVRREKLKEKMDYNLQVKDDCFLRLHQILEQKEELRGEVLKQLEKYHIVL
ncbi:MAG: hypothetical protein HFJ09_08960 [Lachnospiraceae bacterium]|nr:hypothetical protein [Lachnospiraceae bacterium]